MVVGLLAAGRRKFLKCLFSNSANTVHWNSFFIIAILIQPKLAHGQPIVKKPLPLAALKSVSISLVYYIASVLILWVVFKTGFLNSPHECRRIMCNTGQWVLGSNDKIFGYITLYALLGQNALVLPLFYIFILFWGRPRHQELR